MINNIIEFIDNLPRFVCIDGAERSTACEYIFLDVIMGVSIIKWRSGSVSFHSTRRRDMLRLMFNNDASMGQWANRHCLAR